MKLLPHQLAAHEFCVNRRGSINSSDQGTGKTGASIWTTLTWMASNPSWSKILVVCPSSLRYNWLSEFKMWIESFPISMSHLTMAMVEKSSSFPETNIVVCSYDMLHREGVTENIHGAPWDVCIVDEVQYIRNMGSIRSKHILGDIKTIRKSINADKTEELDALLKDGWVISSRNSKTIKLTKDDVKAPPIRARRKIAASGTPIVNSPKDIYPILKWIDPKNWDWYPFAMRYCDGKRGFNGSVEAKGASNLDELHRRLTQGPGAVLFRVLKKDVLKDLPDKMHKIISLPAPEKVSPLLDQEKKLWRLKNELEQELKEAREKAKAGDQGHYRERAATMSAEIMGALGQLASIRKKLGESKVPLAIEHIKATLDAGEPKIIVFGNHRNVLSSIADSLSSYGAMLMLGGTDALKRNEMVVAFQTDPEKRVFVISTQAGGTGLTLHAASRVCIVEPEWTHAASEQASDRAHRYGTTKQVIVEWLLFDNSLDISMVQKSINKASIAEQAIDGTTSTHQPTSTPKDQASAARKLEYQRRGAEMTEEQKQAAHDAIRKLASLDEQARAKHDGSGFSELHRDIGMKLACRIALTPAQAALAKEISIKYSGKLPPSLRIALQS